MIFVLFVGSVDICCGTCITKILGFDLAYAMVTGSQLNAQLGKCHTTRMVCQTKCEEFSILFAVGTCRL